MKKGLLTTSAIVAAGMLTLGTDALAQTKPTNPVQLRLGGYMEQTIGYAFQRPDSRIVGANQNLGTISGTPQGQFDLQTEAEIHVIGDGRLDNGLVIRTVFELEVTGSPGNLYDEAYLILRNGFGQVILGNEDPVASLMTAGYGNGLVTFAGQDLTYGSQSWVPQPNTFIGSPTVSAARAAFMEAPDNNDSSKIIYVSPRFFGFQAGISYAPEYRNQLWDGNDDPPVTTGGGAIDTNKRLPSKDLLNNIWSVGLNYDSLNIGDFKIGFAGAFTQAQKPTLTTGGVIGGLNDPVREFGGGMRVDFGGFRFAVGYKHLENTPGISAWSGSSLFGGLGAGQAANSVDGYGINAGMLYRWGPNAVSLNGRHGTEKGCVLVTAGGTCTLNPAAGTATDDHQTVRGVMVSYARTLAPGIRWSANWLYASYEDQEERDRDNHGSAITTSVRLNF